MEKPEIQSNNTPQQHRKIERRRAYSKRQKRQKRLQTKKRRHGLIKRIQDEALKKSVQIEKLKLSNAAIQQKVDKGRAQRKYITRKFHEIKMENEFLRDEKQQLSCKTRRCTTLIAGTSEHDKKPSLLPCIRIINEKDLDSANNKPIGAGNFGMCYLKSFSHFKVCVKMLPLVQKRSFIEEANIVSKFAHTNLPYLFGVCFGKSLSLVLSYHAMGDQTVTIYDSLFSRSQVIERVTREVDWVFILEGVLCGMEHLHSKQKIIHNDLKCDNVILSLNIVVQAVIIDFGKACDLSKGKCYLLSEKDKQKYKERHSHIAPDLRDGACNQSVMSDIFSFGKIVAAVNECKLQQAELQELADKCLQYNWNNRPNIHIIKNYF